MFTTDKRRICLPARISAILLLAAVLTVGISLAFPKAAALSKPGKTVLKSAKSAGYDSIKLTWKKAAKAKKYQVYCATKKGGKYKLVGTTKKLYFTHKKLKTGKKYYYKVRAINGKAKGPFSKVKGAIPVLGKPKASIEEYGASCIIVLWDPVPGAQYYEVQRCSEASGSEYKMIGTCKDEEYDDYDIEKLKLHYYYRVRACRRVDSKTYRSAWSNEMCSFLAPEDETLTNGLDVKLVKMSSGNIIAVVKNNNSRTVDAYLKVRFIKDDKEHAVAIDDDTLIDLVPGKTAYARFRPVADGDQVSYKDYKLYSSAKEVKGYVDYSDKLKVSLDTSNINTQGVIKVTVTNNAGTDIHADIGFVILDKSNNVLDFNADTFILNMDKTVSDELETIDLKGAEYDRIEPIVFRAGEYN